MFITRKHISRRTVLRGMGVTMALPMIEAMVPARTVFAKTAAGKVRLAAIEMVHGSAGATKFGLQKNLWSPAAVGTRLRSVADQPRPARAVSRLPHDRQQHRRAKRRGVRAAGDRRRSLPLERGVPDAGASATDPGVGRARRRVARPDLRAEVRPGDADPVDAAVHRGGRPGGRLLVWLLLRLHRHDQLGRQGSAAADDSRSAAGVRSAVRRRRHAGGARRSGAPKTRASST